MIYNDCITNNSKHLNRKNRLKEIFSPVLKVFKAEKHFLFPTFLYNVVYKELLLLALLCRKASQLISKYVCTAVCFQLWKQESESLPTDDSNSGGSLIVYSRDTLSGNTLTDAQMHTRVRIQYIHLGCAYAASKCKSIAML